MLPLSILTPTLSSRLEPGDLALANMGFAPMLVCRGSRGAPLALLMDDFSVTDLMLVEVAALKVAGFAIEVDPHSWSNAAAQRLRPGMVFALGEQQGFVASAPGSVLPEYRLFNLQGDEIDLAASKPAVGFERWRIVAPLADGRTAILHEFGKSPPGTAQPDREAFELDGQLS